MTIFREVFMEDGYTFMCGSVPILLLIFGPRGPSGPWGLLQLAAGCLGGWAAYRLFGAEVAPDGGAVSLFLLAVGGGAFAGLLLTVGLGAMKGRAEVNVSQ
jgi:hypothetical protein